MKAKRVYDKPRCSVCKIYPTQHKSGVCVPCRMGECVDCKASTRITEPLVKQILLCNNCRSRRWADGRKFV